MDANTRSFHVEHVYLESVDNCPLCRGQRSRPALEATDHTVSHLSFKIQECASCGFQFTSPRPTAATLGDYYRSPNYISHSNQRKGISDRIYQTVRKRAIANKRKLIQQHVTGGKALDVGCGTGEFLDHLQGHGFQVTGVEPSAIAREQAIANYSLSVLPLLDSIPPLAQFEVITMWHVLEHMPQPHDTLKQIFARAASDALLIIAVPDRESWDAQHYGREWAAYDVPRHLSHFRRQDIDRLISEHGFILKATLPMWFDAPYVSMLTERDRGAGNLVALMKGAIWGTLSNLIALSTRRPTSSTLYIARKGQA